MNDLNHLRRRSLARAIAALCLVPVVASVRAAAARADSEVAADRRWFDAAMQMKRRAQSTGDQPFGAVLVLAGRLVGEGPSRVVALGDASAHAERVAIRDAQRKLQRADLRGSVLYSTSRPCRSCEAAAAAVGVTRMVFGEALEDAGSPRP
jgi:tRNA(Arg) A34 adenosine deaminase TadA